MKRRILITTLFLLILPASLLLADAIIRYVDIEKGQNRIEELGVENTALKNKIESLTQRFFELRQSVKGWNETLYEIRPIIERLRRKKNSLYVILEKIADENLKAKATATYDRSSDLLNRLRTTKEETDNSVRNAINEMDQNRTQINYSLRRMHWNTIEIAALNGSIALTENQVVSLEAIVNGVESINQEVAKYIKN